MSQPRAIQPNHFQAILSWWDGTFKHLEKIASLTREIEANIYQKKTVKVLIQYW